MHTFHDGLIEFEQASWHLIKNAGKQFPDFLEIPQRVISTVSNSCNDTIKRLTNSHELSFIANINLNDIETALEEPYSIALVYTDTCNYRHAYLQLIRELYTLNPYLAHLRTGLAVSVLSEIADLSEAQIKHLITQLDFKLKLRYPSKLVYDIAENNNHCFSSLISRTLQSCAISPQSTY